MRRIFALLISMLFTGVLLDAQSTCTARTPASDPAFKDDERITYAASYTWGPVFTDVGEVVLTVDTEPGKARIKAVARTYKFYDKFFKVRDLYESHFSIPDFHSQYFYRDIFEGDYSIKNTYRFDWERNIIEAKIEREKKPVKDMEIELTPCTLDVIAYFYYLRSIDFSDAYPNKIYVVSIPLDDEVFNIKCRYLGKETKKIKSFGMRVKCLKFAVEVIAGSVFKGDENITMWVSDDKNHIPLELESPIIVGKVKGRILKFENLKYPLNLLD
ncbi:MAG: DUF3108 domain-containing protein [Prevotellaceae bacterium]|nr:DUF3108 domain-containing protein [Prevotellaceae bacterium]